MQIPLQEIIMSAYKLINYLKKEPMLLLSVIAAAAGLIMTPPTAELLRGIDWRTLGILLMMLCVLEGFKQENVLQPLVALAGKLKSMTSLSLFLVFCVFFSSMFVTNDVSLLIFVPLTILLFRQTGREKFILPVITLENIAAVRGSLLTPFGSPQNLFLYGQAEIGAGRFMLHMLPLCLLSGVLLIGFVFFVFRKNLHDLASLSSGEPLAKKKSFIQENVMMLLNYSNYSPIKE
jgi:Na+/H+ antiporter NhaD/arsenite permease-like protein